MKPAGASAEVARTDVVLVAFAAFAGATLAWTLSGPRFLAEINWDTGSYISAIGNGRYTWSTRPWNNHIAVAHLYLLAVHAARAFGGTIIEGFRLLGALAHGLGCALLADATRRLTGHRLLAGLLTLTWMTAWVTLSDHFILEDDLLFLAAATAALRVCVLRVDGWRARDSLVAGAFCGAAALASWQAVPYLSVVVWAALIGGAAPRSAGGRARDAGLAVAGFFAAIFAWLLLVAATSDLGFRALCGVLFSRPNPSYFPRTGAAFLHALSPRSLCEALGRGFAYALAHDAGYDPPAAPIPPIAIGTTGFALEMEALGALGFAIQIAGFAWATRLTVRTGRRAPHLLAAALLLFSTVTSMHRDPAVYAALKRYNFVPLLGVLLLASAAGALGALDREGRLRRGARAGVATLAIAIAIQTALGFRWERQRLASYPADEAGWSRRPHERSYWYGRDGRSFYAYFRDLRRATPAACRHVFGLAEIYDGRWNTDITASLLSELPDHLVLANPPDLVPRQLRRWEHQPHLISIDEARTRQLVSGCAWLSSNARSMLAAALPLPAAMPAPPPPEDPRPSPTPPRRHPDD